MDAKLNNKIVINLYKNYLNADLDLLYTTNYYDKYYYQLSNTAHSMKAIIGILGNFTMNILSIIGIAGLFLNYSIWSLLILFLGIIVSFIFSISEEKKNYKLSVDLVSDNRQQEYVERVFYQPEYSKEVRSNNSEIFFVKLRKIYINIINKINLYGKQISKISFISQSSVFLANTIVLIIVGYSIINQGADVAIFAMLYTGINQISNQLSMIFTGFRSIYRLSFDIDRYMEFLSLSEVSYGDLEIKELDNIEFKNVFFEINNIKIFEDINFKINKAERGVVFIGKNGSGKTTLVNIIAGLYRIHEGKYKINGIDIENFSRASIKDFFSIVFQDFQIYALSIIENISMKEKVTQKEYDRILYILESLGIKDKLLNLPDGLNTIMSNEFQNAMKLSQGELQKIALARAWFKDSKVIIMDEPTSFSDAYLKDSMIPIINEISREKFVILITHDKSLENVFKKKLFVLNKQVIEIE